MMPVSKRRKQSACHYRWKNEKKVDPRAASHPEQARALQRRGREHLRAACTERNLGGRRVRQINFEKGVKVARTLAVKEPDLARGSFRAQEPPHVDSF